MKIEYDVSQEYYNKIIALKETKEIKNVVKKWEILSSNLKKLPGNASVILPDMLWVAKSGVGKTYLLKLISEYLYSKGNLMSFYGNVKFFEFLLSYVSADNNFDELSRLIKEVSNAAGFRNEYRGIIKIDISEWLYHYEDKHFIEFVEYICANKDKWLVILSVDSDDKKAVHNLEAFLSMFLRLERVNFSLPSTALLVDYVENKLMEFGITLTDGARELILKTVEKLRENKHFDGYKSLELMCQDIVYCVFTNENFETYQIDEKALSEFAYDSEYVERTVANYDKVNRIGFAGVV